jgi:hypothetical protein
MYIYIVYHICIYITYIHIHLLISISTSIHTLEYYSDTKDETSFVGKWIRMLIMVTKVQKRIMSIFYMQNVDKN